MRNKKFGDCYLLCKNFSHKSVKKQSDCRNCTKNETKNFKPGDWCHSYEPKRK